MTRLGAALTRFAPADCFVISWSFKAALGFAAVSIAVAILTLVTLTIALVLIPIPLILTLPLITIHLAENPLQNLVTLLKATFLFTILLPRYLPFCQ